MDLMDTAQLLGNFGEFVGAIGVVATLAYLAIQIRQNTRATHAASHHAVTDSLNQGNIAMAQDAELAQIWATGCADRGSLTGPPGVREWWDQNPYGLSQEFRSYIDGFRGT
jgi:hypothetical protein